MYAQRLHMHPYVLPIGGVGQELSPFINTAYVLIDYHNTSF